MTPEEHLKEATFREDPGCTVDPLSELGRSIALRAIREAVREQADSDRAFERLHVQEAEARAATEAVKPGNALYATIVRNILPYFPAGTRDLDWDVLPGTLLGLARGAAEAEARARREEREACRREAANLAHMHTEDGSMDEFCRGAADVEKAIAAREDVQPTPPPPLPERLFSEGPDDTPQHPGGRA